MRLCERLNVSPDELDAMALSKVMDAIVVLHYESEIARQKG